MSRVKRLIVLRNRLYPSDLTSPVLKSTRDNAVTRPPHPATPIFIVNEVNPRRPISPVKRSTSTKGSRLDGGDLLGHLGFVEQPPLIINDEKFLLGRRGEIRYPDAQQSHSLAQIKGIQHPHRQLGDPLRRVGGSSQSHRPRPDGEVGHLRLKSDSASELPRLLQPATHQTRMTLHDLTALLAMSEVMLEGILH